MKTLFIAIIVLLLTLTLGFAEDGPFAEGKTLVFNFSLEGGWLPLNSFLIYENEKIADSSSEQGFVTLKAELVFFNLIFIGGDIRTEFHTEDFIEGNHYLYPNMENYGFNVGIRPIKGVEIGFRHRCIHPVLTYIPRNVSNTTFNYEGAYEELYIKFEGSITLF